MEHFISFLLKRFSLVLLLTTLAAVAWAQEVVVTGKIVDQNGAPIIGATVIVKGTTTGVSSDMDGNYTIQTTANSTLVFSYIGYETVEEQVNGRTLINVSMLEAFAELEEIVIIGYGQVKKKDATGSVATVSSSDFNKGAIATPMELLMGRTAGVQITTNSGAPGDGATIRIRGGSSLSASNDPLIVLDGTPLDNGGINGVRNPLSTINPNDIESFTILKDASATAIYGSRASNGVIIITTKKGRMGAPLKLNYSTNLTLNTIAKKPLVYSADEFRTLIQEKVDEGFIPEGAIDLLGDASTDWLNQVFTSAMSHEHNISATGSIKNLPFRTSINYSNQNGILQTDNMNRIIGSVSLTPSLLDDNLKLTINANGTKMSNTFADRGAIGSAVSFDPTKPVMDNVTGENYGGYFTWVDSEGYPNGLAPSNPVALLDIRSDESDAMRFTGNFQADYTMPFFPDMKANLNLALDQSKSEGNVYVPYYASWSFDKNEDRDGGTRSAYEQEKKNQLLDFYLNYNKEISSISSKFDVMGGYSWQHFWENSYSFKTNDYQSEETKIDIEDKTTPSEYYLLSFFGRFNYIFSDKYIFTFTLRNDGTSRFAPENRWGLFPSYALAWKISEESFIKDIDFISDLK
ncbi:MAG TPA: SusC/RagA family TonB-linked outer membrane protein, partial [Tenuifilaceae bacterium]|nr:SusC/RagA family TonB-linked outer membrane protein [Tenuifilaceae bacterium]HPJ47239.1 SusC/RagA family TonB-linked outer membrane protein [Tenuifilaceae bacterium]HPQ35951.1 SusC/RagA family TonB-linked outer membrane protein [Tenuifilaceae bacterium]HRX69436.1 SusC/RagA family TonB-linked outer membrane protein [Tenuifilaceae bacterium]